MDESFKARVEKVFGSLTSSQTSSLYSSSSSASSTLWSISGGEVERRIWRRWSDTSGRDETPCSSSFDEFLKNDRRVPRRRDFDEDPDEDRERGDDDGGLDEWGIRSSIGLDRTLDCEEEEDEYDKVASGRDNAGDRLDMNDVTEKGSFLNSKNVLGNKKDTSANHLDAKHRLKEDEAEAQKFAEIKEPADVEVSKDEAWPKPILKRKHNDAVFKPQKRVRFNVESKNDIKETSPNEVVFKASGLPDYLVNLSKYTFYSLESTSEVDEVSNTRACGTFLNEVKNLNRETGSYMGNEFGFELPKSVTFISKKKASEAKVIMIALEGSRAREVRDGSPCTNRASQLALQPGKSKVRKSKVKLVEQRNRTMLNVRFGSPEPSAVKLWGLHIPVTIALWNSGHVIVSKKSCAIYPCW